jgi:ATP-binding cassette subfamily B protein
MTNDTLQITQFINGMMRIFFKAPIMCAGSILMAFMLSPRMSVVLFIAVSAVAVLITVSMRMSYVRFAKVQYAIDKVNSVVQEYLLGVRLVKAFGRYDDEERKFGRANDHLSAKSEASQRVIAYFSPLMSLAGHVGIVSILYLGSVLFQSGVLKSARCRLYQLYGADSGVFNYADECVQHLCQDEGLHREDQGNTRQRRGGGRLGRE